MTKKTDQMKPVKSTEAVTEQDLDRAQGGVEQLALNYTPIKFEYKPRSRS